MYRARQEKVGRSVALKVMRRSLLGDFRAVKRFYREARAAAVLDHANVIQLFEVGGESIR